MAAPPLETKLRCLHHFLHPFFHLLRGDIFHMRGHAPEMSEGILNEAGAVAVKLVLHRLQDFRALGLRALNYAIDVGKIHVRLTGLPPTAVALVCPCPMPGFSSASMMCELPIFNSA